MTVTFGNCRFDSSARRLTCNGREAHLSPKAFELLKVLIDNRERAVSKAELLERIWPDVFVADGSLAKVVNEIRDAVGVAHGTPVIRTVHRFGYALAAEVREERAVTRISNDNGGVNWWLSCGRREFALTDGRHVAGRTGESSITLDSPKVSRLHAQFDVDGESIAVRDLGSKNGTYVRERRIAEPTRLKSGDEVRIGPFRLIVRWTMATLTETEADQV
jgi:DNA-binding winged helix-turn-helix (wHTH) protein